MIACKYICFYVHAGGIHRYICVRMHRYMHTYIQEAELLKESGRRVYWILEGGIHTHTCTHMHRNTYEGGIHTHTCTHMHRNTYTDIHTYIYRRLSCSRKMVDMLVGGSYIHTYIHVQEAKLLKESCRRVDWGEIYIHTHVHACTEIHINTYIHKYTGG
jgi:hypothetical protein